MTILWIIRCDENVENRVDDAHPNNYNNHKEGFHFEQIGCIHCVAMQFSWVCGSLNSAAAIATRALLSPNLSVLSGLRTSPSLFVYLTTLAAEQWCTSRMTPNDTITRPCSGLPTRRAETPLFPVTTPFAHSKGGVPHTLYCR